MTLAPHAGNAPKIREALPLADSGRNMSLLILGSPGTGKTTLDSLLELQSLRRGFPGVTFDPLGTLTPALIYQLLHASQNGKAAAGKRVWRKIRYIDVGNPDVVTSFPIYFTGSARSLWEVSSRFLRVLRLAYPKLETEAPVTWPRIRRVGIMAGAVLAGLSYQLTEIEDLLFNTMEWEKSGKFAEVIRRNPEAARAVSYFRYQYLPLSKSAKSELISPLLDHVFPFVHDPLHRRLFGGSTLGINWQDTDKQGERVVLDFHKITDPDTKRFALLWIFNSLDEYLKQRARKDTPFVVTIDEFAALAQQVSDNVNPLAVMIDELIQQYCRHNRIWFNCSFQSLNQIDRQLRNTLLSVGNIVVSRTPAMPEARILADILFRTNPYQVKQIRRVWGREAHLSPRLATNVVIDQFDEYMHLTEQQEEYAKLLVRLPQFHFLCRLAPREGEVSQEVIRMSIAAAAQSADIAAAQDTVNSARDRLAARSGIPVATVMQELDARLPREMIEYLPPEPTGQPTGEGRRRQNRNKDMANGDVRQVQTTPSLPTLAEKERAFLAFLAAHPDLPVNQVYKGLRIRAAEVTKIRENLKTQGLIAELEVRPTGTGAGRPLKCLVPTMQAFTLLGSEPPAGRGGVIHRQLQQLIAQGATAKGYTARCEKELGNGAIVDVHLEKGGERVAVEIAVMSHPSRELAHIRQSLSAGYDKVFTVFLDSQLLERTREALGIVFSDAELSRIQLIPVSKLAGIG
jgi:hypothetical protein